MIALCRLLFTGLPLIQTDITNYLSEQLNSELRFKYVDSDWQSGSPKLSIRGLTLQGKGASQPGFQIGQFDMELDLRASLLKWTLVFKTLQIDQVVIDLVQGDGASWSLQGIEAISGSSASSPTGLQGKFLEWLNNQKNLDIRGIQLNLVKSGGEKTQVNGKYLTLILDGNLKRLSARLEAEAGFVEVKGEGIQNSRWDTSWSGSVTADSMDLEKLCALWSGCYDDIGTTEVDAETKWQYHKNRWQVNGRISVPNVVYRDISGSWRTLGGWTDLFLQYEQGKDWQIWLNDFNVRNDMHVQNDSDQTVTRQWNNNWYLAGQMGKEYSITIASEKIDLDQLKLWMLDTGFVPESLADLVNVLNPYGYLNNVAMRVYPSRQPFDFDLSADLEDISVDAWEGAPSGGNVNGSVRMGLLKGYLDVDTENLSLGLTKLFRDDWYFDTARGRLYWDVIDDTCILKSDDLTLTAPEGTLKGKLRLDIPLSWDEGETLDMALTVGMTDGDARFTPKYLPALLPGMDDSLVQWLDNSIKSADIKSGGFLYNGALVDGERDEDSRWGLFFEVENGHIQYAPEWPEVTGLSGQVFVNDSRVLVNADSAKSAGGQLRHVNVHVPLGADPFLQLDGRLQADGKVAKHFLTQTPIDQVLQGEARNWSLAGQIDAGLKLRLPINDLNRYQFQLNADLKDFRYAIPEENIEVNDIQGRLNVDTETGLKADHLTGQFLGESTNFSIHTTMKGNQPESVDIDQSGRISVLKLQQWLGMDWLSLLEGESAYQSKLKIGLATKEVEFSVSSDLQGMEIELPAPLAKTVDKPMAFNLNLKAGKQPILNASLGDLGQASLLLMQDYTLDAASIVLGVEDKLPKQQPGKLLVTGSLTELDIEPWAQRFGGQPGNKREQRVANRLEVSDVRIRQLKYGEYQWSDMLMSLSSDQEAIKLSAQGPDIDGALWMPHELDVPYRLVVNKLRLPEQEDAEDQTPLKDEEPEQDILADVNPSLLPEADIDIKSLQIGDKPATAVSFKLRQQENGIKIDDINQTFGGMKLTGLADWIEVDGEQRSWFQGSLRGKDIRQLQKTLGIPELLTAEHSQIDVNLNWKGSPAGARFKEVKGSVDVDLKEGRINQADGSAGALRLFGILNVETFRRRMQLDFSDLYSSGIAFDKVTGAIRFNQGLVTFDKPVMIEGPNSSFKLDGTANANADTDTEQLDLKLVVTLPVTSNLPILSVLLGSSPQLAGIIFIADKLVGKQVDKLASIRYRILGSFEEPEMTLDQLFSGKDKKKSGSSK